MALPSPLADTLQPSTICILSPVRVKEATFMKLGELQKRSIRLVHGDIPEHKAIHDYEETTYVAQLCLHLTHCDELVRLPLLVLEEEDHFDFSYTLDLDFREGSDLMDQIMPHFSSISIYHYDRVQCDINVFELLATATCGSRVQRTADKASGTDGLSLTVPMSMGYSAPSPTQSALHEKHNRSDDSESAFQDDEEMSAQGKGQIGTILFAPLKPGKSLARKVTSSVRKLTNREKSGHKRTPSNPQLVLDTVGIDNGHWHPKPGASYESCVSINLGSDDDSS